MLQKIELLDKDMLYDVKEYLPNIFLDIRYATTNNFTGNIVYESDKCFLRGATLKKLINAVSILKEQGFNIKIFDGYRTTEAQIIFWEFSQQNEFVSNPYKRGSMYSRGCAVDLTLVTPRGKEVVMPSDFDDFSIKASRLNPNMSKKAKSNLKILTDAMIESGFNIVDSEWWHYYDKDWEVYNIIR